MSEEFFIGDEQLRVVKIMKNADLNLQSIQVMFTHFVISLQTCSGLTSGRKNN